MTLALSVMATVSFASVMTAVTVTKKEFDKFLADVATFDATGDLFF